MNSTIPASESANSASAKGERVGTAASAASAVTAVLALVGDGSLGLVTVAVLVTAPDAFWLM